MNIKLNGEYVDWEEEELTIEQVLEKLDISPQGLGIAIALNNKMIPRAQWSTQQVVDSNIIDIVSARQGG